MTATPPLPAAMAPVGIRAFTATTAAGRGLHPLSAALAEDRRALRPNDWGAVPLPTWVGRVDGLDRAPLPPAWAHWDARVTRLAWQALQADGFIDAVAAARASFGAARIGLALGTSASTIGVTEAAYRDARAVRASRAPGDPLAAQEDAMPPAAFPLGPADAALNTPHAVADFVQRALGLEGPCVTVSTACSSSAKAFAHGERWLRLGWVDAVVVGGVEALCDSIVYGFHALGLVDPDPCRPFDHRRRGISIGEAAGFALLTREATACRLRGYGESNDAHHMSAPHPDGRGAELALDAALARGGVDIEAVDYLNLHGTGTPHNDAAEAALVARRYGPAVHASATKGITGHTMGAAGIVEAAICLLALETGLRPGSAGCDAPDADHPATIRRAPAHAPTRLAASHSFGFGGSNAVLLFDRGTG